jgi:hypothetical protein
MVRLKKKDAHTNIPPPDMQMSQPAQKWGGKKNAWIEAHLLKSLIITGRSEISAMI